MIHPLRPYQADALERASEASSSSNGILVVMPTGTGKTRLAVEACARHVERGGFSLFVAPRRELVTQASAALFLRQAVPGFNAAVTTVQSLMKSDAPPPASLVVLDEARHYVADEWGRMRELFPDAVFLGLDATPERGDGRGLGGMFDVLIEAITVKDAIDGGYLVPCEIIRPKHALGPRELAMHPVDAYFKHISWGSTVLFAPSVELAQKYAAELSARGVVAQAVWGDMPSAERDRALADYNAGITRVLCNVQLLTEGWDAPRTENIILASGCGTVGGLLQRIGRGLRPCPEVGKTRCLLLDLNGITHTHGDPDEERTWHLEGRAARRANDDPNVRFCPVCGGVVTTSECEACGHSGEMKKRKPRILGLPMDRFARERAASDEIAAKAYAGLLRFAHRRGYRQGWADKVFSHKYGRPVTWELKRLAARTG